MILAPLPENEEARLAALREYEILDTAPETLYDDFTKLASYLCGTPIATITLIDKTRQWFKSKVGFDFDKSPRELSFCAHAILDHKMTLVNNATLDERFADNPSVTDSPHIRFYAGAPLINRDGFALGTLCVIDSEPRELTQEQQDLLEILARQVVGLIESRQVAAKLAAALINLEKVSKLVPICSHCKGVRNDKGFWKSIEEYLFTERRTGLTHGICPGCLEKHFPAEFSIMKKSGMV